MTTKTKKIPTLAVTVDNPQMLALAQRIADAKNADPDMQGGLKWTAEQVLYVATSRGLEEMASRYLKDPA